MTLPPQFWGDLCGKGWDSGAQVRIGWLKLCTHTGKYSYLGQIVDRTDRRIFRFLTILYRKYSDVTESRAGDSKVARGRKLCSLTSRLPFDLTILFDAVFPAKFCVRWVSRILGQLVSHTTHGELATGVLEQISWGAMCWKELRLFDGNNDSGI